MEFKKYDHTIQEKIIYDFGKKKVYLNRSPAILKKHFQ
jgi:hypothetical protein